MCKGPGTIQASITAAMKANPNRSFSLNELASVAYPGINFVEKKNRVATMRAARISVVEVDWSWWRADSRGGTALFFNPYDVWSYCHARLRCRWGKRYFDKTPEQLDCLMDPGHRDHVRDAIPGGIWHQDVARWTAERDEDTERLVQLEAERHQHIAIAEAAHGATPRR